jgi:hypothetical protein
MIQELQLHDIWRELANSSAESDQTYPNPSNYTKRALPGKIFPLLSMLLLSL